MGKQLHADVAIIGAGIVGAASAYYLARRGLRVVVVDSHPTGFRQSSRNFGFVQQILSQHIGGDPTEHLMMIEAVRIWEGLETELQANLEWVQEGNLAIAESEQRFEDLRGRFMPLASALGIRASMLDSAQVAARLPGLKPKMPGGFLTHADGHAEPRKVARAYMSAARRLGVTVIQEGAKGLLRDGVSVAGVTTDSCEVRATKTVCAAGAVSHRFAKAVGVHLPQRRTRVTVVRTAPAAPAFAVAAWVGSLSFRQSTDGSFILGNKHPDVDLDLGAFSNLFAFLPSYLEFRKTIDFHVGKPLLRSMAAVLPGSKEKAQPFTHDIARDVQADGSKVKHSLAIFSKLFPAHEGIRVSEAWAGEVDHTPDRKCVIGEHPTVPNLVFASGFSGHGFGMGPIAGRLVAELIHEAKPSIEIDSIGPARFDRKSQSEDSGLQPGAVVRTGVPH